MNKVILAGRLTKDPEVRYTQTGIAVARFNLAVNRRIRFVGKKPAETANGNNAATAEQMQFGEEIPPDEDIPF